jgi:hypothetical protein
VTAAHAGWTRGTITPAPRRQGPGGPAGAAGTVGALGATAAVCPATAAAPLPAVTRRPGGSDTRPPVPHAHAAAARAQGRHLPHRTTRWCQRGVRGPGRTATAAARGANADRTGRTPGITALQGQAMALVGRAVALAGPARRYRPPPGRTERPRLGHALAQIGRLTGPGDVVPPARTEPGPPLRPRGFPRRQRGLRVVAAPVFAAHDHLCTHRTPPTVNVHLAGTPGAPPRSGGILARRVPALVLQPNPFAKL